MQIGQRGHKSLVLLGAGATRGSYKGIGTAKIRPPLNGDFFQIARRFVQTVEGRRYRAAMDRLNSFIETEMGDGASGTPTMEQVFNVLFMSKDLPRVFFKRGKPRTAGYRVEIKDFVTLVVALLRFVQMNPKHPGGIDHHARLVAHLEPGDAVLSLNYDTLIDNALAERGWNPRRGYGFTLDPTKIRRAHYPVDDAVLDEVLLLKPHGSLNWFTRGSVQNLEGALQRKRTPKIEVGGVPRANLATGQVRLFIPPLYVKFFANPFWRAIWEKAFLSARDAKVLVIIGCSLIETDFHLRSILASALARRQEKYRRLVIVEPSATVVKRLKSFLRGRAERTDAFQDFSDFVQALD